jgi:hypothetical protein
MEYLKKLIDDFVAADVADEEAQATAETAEETARNARAAATRTAAEKKEALASLIAALEAM